MSFTIVALAYYPWLAPLLVPFTCGVALSRVVLGLHYPSDVLAATAIAIVLASASLTWCHCRCKPGSDPCSPGEGSEPTMPAALPSSLMA